MGLCGADTPVRQPRAPRDISVANTRSGLHRQNRGHDFVALVHHSEGIRNLTTKSVLTAIGAKPLPEETHSCWSCGSMRAAHFCESCGKVQPPAPADYFSFFGVPPKLNLDVTALETDFYALSRKLHPDLNAATGSQEQEWSLEQSSMLNDAYRTLKDPIKRTQYLLHLEGVELEEQSKTATEQARASGELKKQIVPPDLLEEVFELNMHLEELRMNKKAGDDDPALFEEIGKAKLSLETKHEGLLKELQACWKDWDSVIDRGPKAGAEERAQVRNKMVDVLNRRNYIRNLVRDVNAAMEN
jgi:molecular chaperone HscB